MLLFCNHFLQSGKAEISKVKEVTVNACKVMNVIWRHVRFAEISSILLREFLEKIVAYDCSCVKDKIGR